MKNEDEVYAEYEELKQELFDNKFPTCDDKLFTKGRIFELEQILEIPERESILYGKFIVS